jgi:prevent-host-death family protein
LEQSFVPQLVSCGLEREALDLREESKGLFPLEVRVFRNGLASRGSDATGVVLRQTVESAAILRDDLPPKLQYPRSDLRADLNRSQDDHPFLDARSDQITLMQVGRTKGVLIKRHRQAVALPANLHHVHATPPAGIHGHFRIYRNYHATSLYVPSKAKEDGHSRCAATTAGRVEHYTAHMTIKVTATEAKARFLSLLDEVQAGQDVEITRHGRPVARIVPARGPHALKDAFKGVAMSTVKKDEDLYKTGVRWNVERRPPR